MTKETENGTLITLYFSGTRKRFANIDELDDFMQSQLSAWYWLEKAAQKDKNLRKVYEPIGSYLAEVGYFIGWYKMQQTQQMPHRRKISQTKLINNFISDTRTAVGNGFILDETPIARFVSTIRDNKSSQIAGYALAYLNNIRIKATNPAAHEGVFLAMNYLHSPKLDFVKARQMNVKSARFAWKNRSEKQDEGLEEKNKLLISENAALQERSVLLIKKTEEQVAMQASVFETQVAKQASILERQFVKHASALENQAANQASVFKNQIIGQKAAFENQAASQANVFENQKTTQTSDFVSQLAKQTSVFEVMLDKEKNKLTILVDIFKEKMKLNESISYWTRKRIHHRIITIFMAISTLLIAVITAASFTIMAVSLFTTSPTLIDKIASKAPGFSKPFFLAILDPSISKTTAPRTKTTTIITGTKTTSTTIISDVNTNIWTTDNLWKVSVMILISTIGVWLVRLSTKIFISNLHLGTDTYERVTMIKTYFALLAEDKGLRSTDRELILQTLFRPSTTGFIKDDGPSNIPEVFAKTITRR